MLDEDIYAFVRVARHGLLKSVLTVVIPQEHIGSLVEKELNRLLVAILGGHRQSSLALTVCEVNVRTGVKNCLDRRLWQIRRGIDQRRREIRPSKDIYVRLCD
jgi:hypothetical protein